MAILVVVPGSTANLGGKGSAMARSLTINLPIGLSFLQIWVNHRVMETTADFVEEQSADEGRILRFSGNLLLAGIAPLDKRLALLADTVSKIDISGVDHIDTTGAWLIYRTARDHDAPIIGASSKAQRLISEVRGSDNDAAIKPPEINPILLVLSELGASVAASLSGMVKFMGFIGQVILGFGATIRHPSRLRVNAIVQRFETVGVRALAIVGLMSFLIGIVIAQQGAVQLRQFGAEVFTVNLIGRLTFRELGVLMTAIMVAGRSGSAFAAEIGTMKITEEIDAMRTIGVSPIEALVIPRTLATVLMMPLLAFYSCLIAVVGGGILCWAILDIPPATYVDRLREVTPMTDFYVGMIKAPVFGAIIAIAGCFQGMQVENNSEEVGKKTTAAVVQAIFLVIVLDAFFAVFFSGIGWN
jgi:phospholipid/cholesterol/gamma-HCH transport system permease protein